MNLTFKLYATLAKLLPADARDHAVRVELDDGASAWDVIDRFGVPRDSAHLVLLNGVFLPPEDRHLPSLKDGDTLAVWPPVAGG